MRALGVPTVVKNETDQFWSFDTPLYVQVPGRSRPSDDGVSRPSEAAKVTYVIAIAIVVD
jgi:hypothetical protein